MWENANENKRSFLNICTDLDSHSTFRHSTCFWWSHVLTIWQLVWICMSLYIVLFVFFKRKILLIIPLKGLYVTFRKCWPDHRSYCHTVSTLSSIIAALSQEATTAKTPELRHWRRSETWPALVGSGVFFSHLNEQASSFPLLWVFVLS